jgi:DNA repair protein RecN (Recombination protein N)
MLNELRIENFAIIDRLELSFSEGLNVLTGETGAGKSIIVDALELLLGARADLDQIRTGSDQAVVEAAISIPDRWFLRQALQAQDLLNPHEQDLILRRVISRSGKGRILVNGHLITLATLQEIGRGLVDIHGQHDHQSLLYSDHQRELLDAYGKLLPLKEEYADLYRGWRDLGVELEALEKLRHEKAQRMEYLQHQIEEIRSADLQSGEDISLEQEREVLAHSQKLSEYAESAYQILYESDPSILEGLLKTGGYLKEIRSIDQRFTETLELLEAAQAQVKEVAERLRHYKSGIEHDPDRLQQIEGRLYQISKLKKKYGPTLEDVLRQFSKLSQDLSLLEHHEEKSEALKKVHHESEEKVFELATRLRGSRAHTAKRFKVEIEKELKHLGMGQAELVVNIDRLNPLQADELGPHGADKVAFLIAGQTGEDPRPLNKVASGGELSRIMLAIKTILAEVDQVPVLIFDEVDAGVGGAVAEAVGRRLKSVARTHQVFCITHLPQIAMLADGHYRVGKVIEAGRTVTQVSKLDRSERVQEIARMLGGKEITSITLQHAKELLTRSEAKVGFSSKNRSS